jgi:hypothetical protein
VGYGWSSVSEVTCDAVNTQTGQTFTASGLESSWGGLWDPNAVPQQVLQQALDECASGSGNAAACIPATTNGFYNGCFLTY